MRPTFVLGRVRGVEVGVNWSVLVVFVLIALGLAQGRLPAAHPGRSAVLYWVVGLVAAVVFFGSLLAHEMAHAVVARREGVEVDGITLWLLGGAARMRAEAGTPGAEVRIAGVGPLVSGVLGVAFTLVAWLLDAASASALVVEAVAWLAGINILLALFNAVPAAPLDGGRLLRAVLWWRTGDRLRATVGATTAGRVLGWALVLLGLYLFLVGPMVNGVWLALIGWFLLAAATVEGRQARVQDALSGIPVRRAMTPEPVNAPADLTVADFLDGPLFRYRHSAFPVTDGGAPVGLVTLHRIRRVPVAERGTTVLADVMRPLAEVATAGPEEPLGDVLPRLESAEERRVLVLDDGALVGIVSPSDVSRTVAWLTSIGPGRRGGPGHRGGERRWGQ
ncbi:site-2 protease family protein [Allostreptomyces psammosilenae]|uniref:Zinc metalloprotease n=1 Tax=Allostreptomyces psammosilenae TaxID=1892865 RepID=A0A852ZVK0_9ACTN|nr:site-2 protease family protein [Allostreptomyces psammosilenae]NYI06406.1 Zn-dependent protease/predicted transcriptional regulator [Allostreptomyces psammosilenae]